MTGLANRIEESIWVCSSLFSRGFVTGSSANMSFYYEGSMYITASGSCFGRLKENDFVCVSPDSSRQHSGVPSKEHPLHKRLYAQDPAITAVLHTHSYYAALWSCFEQSDINDCIPKYTPYLAMKVGPVKWVPYAPPGTSELFDLFGRNVDGRKGYLLGNHGPVVAGTSPLDAFYGLEELETSARIAWDACHYAGTLNIHKIK